MGLWCRLGQYLFDRHFPRKTDADHAAFFPGDRSRKFLIVKQRNRH